MRMVSLQITQPILHFIFYVAFVITQIELIEVFIDGFSGGHRYFFHAGLGNFYVLVISAIELLSILTFIATLIFFARRNIIKLPRFTMAELKGWPRNDANLILLFELLLIGFIFLRDPLKIQAVVTFGSHMQTYLTKEQILERIQALPKKSKYLTREEINQRIDLACELGLFTKNPTDSLPSIILWS